MKASGLLKTFLLTLWIMLDVSVESFIKWCIFDGCSKGQGGLFNSLLG